MKKLFLLSLLLASCHGKQIVPAGEGEPDNDYGMMVIDSQHKLREVPPMMIFHGKIDTTPPRNKMIEVQKTKGTKETQVFTSLTILGTNSTRNYEMNVDSLWVRSYTPITIKPQPLLVIIHNTDTITAYPGDTVRIR